MSQVRVPNEFFAKSKLEYSNWRWAFFRELIQNAYDACATTINFTIAESEDGNHLDVSCKDNGTGMTRDILVDVLLCLGGSKKADGSIGGFGYAKSLLFFAHEKYEIRTREHIVVGSGGEYTISEARLPTSGTFIRVVLRKENFNMLLDLEQELTKYASYTAVSRSVTLTLNGNTLPLSQFSAYKHFLNTALGGFHFKELTGHGTGGHSTVVVSVRGLPMFMQTVMCGGTAFVGVLELKGDTFEILTANRDSLKASVANELTRIIQKMSEERSTLMLGHSVKVQLNYTRPSSLSQAGQRRYADMEQDADVFEGCSEKTLPDIINVDYPSNFQVRMHNLVEGARAKSKVSSTDSVGVSAVLKMMKLRWVKDLAHAWKKAVFSVLATEYAHSLGVRYCLDGIAYENGAPYILDYDDGEFYVSGNNLRISTGFVIAADIEGMNVRTAWDTDQLILCNPNFFDKDFLAGDLTDLAIHECAHIPVSGHGEAFVDSDMKFRRSLRRRSMLLKAQRTLKKGV